MAPLIVVFDPFFSHGPSLYDVGTDCWLLRYNQLLKKRQ